MAFPNIKAIEDIEIVIRPGFRFYQACRTRNDQSDNVGISGISCKPFRTPELRVER